MLERSDSAAEEARESSGLTTDDKITPDYAQPFENTNESHLRDYEPNQFGHRFSNPDASSSAPLRYPFKIPINKPYSVPEPHLYQGITKAEVLRRNIGKTDAEMVRPTWYADRAGPALLLTFDAFDTLYTPDPSPAEQYTEVARTLGYDVEVDQVKTSFKDAFKSVSKNDPDLFDEALQKYSYKAYWARIIQNTFENFRPEGRNWPDEELELKLLHRFSTDQGYRLLPGVRELLSLIGTSWQARNWPPKRTMLGIVSNTDPRTRSVLHSFGIPIRTRKAFMYPPRYIPINHTDNPKFGSAGFAFAAISYECGFEKPDLRIFMSALKKAQRKLDEAEAVDRLTRSGKDMLSNIHEEFHHMHVGDSLEKDVIPALALGWDAVLVDRSASDEVVERDITVPINGDEQSRQMRTYHVVNNLIHIQKLVTKERLIAGLEARLGHPVQQRRVPQPDPLRHLPDTNTKERRRRMGLSAQRAHKTDKGASAHASSIGGKKEPPEHDASDTERKGFQRVAPD